MTFRITKIITKTGDDGMTGLGDGTRAVKSSLRIHAIGEVDELNAYLGLVLAQTLDMDIRENLTKIQHQLFDVGSELAVPGWHVIDKPYLVFLEHIAQLWCASLQPLEEFILPGGAEVSAQIHILRTMARRAERSVVALREQSPEVSQWLVTYLNRLSDVMFILAREVNRRLDVADVFWQKNQTSFKA